MASTRTTWGVGGTTQRHRWLFDYIETVHDKQSILTMAVSSINHNRGDCLQQWKDKRKEEAHKCSFVFSSFSQFLDNKLSVATAVEMKTFRLWQTLRGLAPTLVTLLVFMRSSALSWPRPPIHTLHTLMNIYHDHNANTCLACAFVCKSQMGAIRLIVLLCFILRFILYFI